MTTPRLLVPVLPLLVACLHIDLSRACSTACC